MPPSMLTTCLGHRSYGSGFPRAADPRDCGWNLNRLKDNPQNVLHAVGTCVPGVTRCARPAVPITRTCFGLTGALPPTGRGCTWVCSSPHFVGTEKITTYIASTSCTTALPKAGMGYLAPLQAASSARCGTRCRVCSTRCGLMPALSRCHHDAHPLLLLQAPDLLHRLTTLISPAACTEHGANRKHLRWA
jgi:hypothetical protein